MEAENYKKSLITCEPDFYVCDLSIMKLYILVL